jgi:hypothetical protein
MLVKYFKKSHQMFGYNKNACYICNIMKEKDMTTQTIQFADGTMEAPVDMFNAYNTESMSVAKAAKLKQMLTDGGHRGEVKVMSACDLLDNILYQGMSELYEGLPASFDVDYEEQALAMLDWANANNAYLFCAPKEECFEWKAVQEATALGKAIVVIENLS